MLFILSGQVALEKVLPEGDGNIQGGVVLSIIAQKAFLRYGFADFW